MAVVESIYQIANCCFGSSWLPSPTALPCALEAPGPQRGAGAGCGMANNAKNESKMCSAAQVSRVDVIIRKLKDELITVMAERDSVDVIIRELKDELNTVKAERDSALQKTAEIETIYEDLQKQMFQRDRLIPQVIIPQAIIRKLKDELNTVKAERDSALQKTAEIETIYEDLQKQMFQRDRLHVEVRGQLCRFLKAMASRGAPLPPDAGQTPTPSTPPPTTPPRSGLRGHSGGALMPMSGKKSGDGDPNFAMKVHFQKKSVVVDSRGLVHENVESQVESAAQRRNRLKRERYYRDKDRVKDMQALIGSQGSQAFVDNDPVGGAASSSSGASSSGASNFGLCRVCGSAAFKTNLGASGCDGGASPSDDDVDEGAAGEPPQQKKRRC